ncbi:hypothetical protein [Variovorax sp. GT1P44]|uniref:hypothetical protein n=1 Tax=Variovorax sp. GT1P44 TaxID=3443742 RepID=UPI003F45445C
MTLTALLLTALLYSDWFKAYWSNNTFNSIFSIVMLPAMLVAMVFADGVDSVEAVHFSFGMVAEALVMWGLYHAFRLARERMAKFTDDVDESGE